MLDHHHPSLALDSLDRRRERRCTRADDPQVVLVPASLTRRLFETLRHGVTADRDWLAQLVTRGRDDLARSLQIDTLRVELGKAASVVGDHSLGARVLEHRLHAERAVLAGHPLDLDTLSHARLLESRLIRNA